MNIASIDIGTNTILMVLAKIEKETESIITLKNFQEIPRLGKGLSPGQPFESERRQRVLEIIQYYSEQAKLFGCETILASGTYPFRTAIDSQELIDGIKKSTGIEITVLSGEQEAELAYLGAAKIHDSRYQSVIIDIGGGSTEIVIGRGDAITYRKSFLVGAVSFTEKFITGEKVLNLAYLEKTAQQIFQDELPRLSDAENKVIAIAGTPTTLACMKAGLKSFDEEKIDGIVLTSNELRLFLNDIAKLSPYELLGIYGNIVKGREDVLLAGTLLLQVIISILNSSEAVVSTKGIRYGAIQKFCFRTFGRYFEL